MTQTISHEMFEQFKSKVEEEIEKAELELLEVLFFESDRGSVIVVQSMLDEQLFDLFTALFRLNSDMRRQELNWLLKGSLAPLGGFFRRVQMAFAMGFIDRDLKKILEDINDIRVGTAHNHSKVLIDEGALSRLIEKFDKAHDGHLTKQLQVLIPEMHAAIGSKWPTIHPDASLESRVKLFTCAVTARRYLKGQVLILSCFGLDAKRPYDWVEKITAFIGGQAPTHQTEAAGPPDSPG